MAAGEVRSAEAAHALMALLMSPRVARSADWLP